MGPEEGARVILRKSEIGDIDQVMEILADGRRALESLGIDQWQGGYPHREVVERDIALGESYVVETAGKNLVATAMISFRGERDYLFIEDGAWMCDSSDDLPCYVVVHRVAVMAAHKESGVASFIMRRAEELALEGGYISVRIETHANNVPMRNLLAKRGYTQCGTITITHDGESPAPRIAYEKLVVLSDTGAGR